MDKVTCSICGGEFSNKMFKLHVKNSHLHLFESEGDLNKFVLNHRFGLTDEMVEKFISEYNEVGLVDRMVKKYGIPHKSMSEILTLNGVTLNTFEEACSLPHKHQAYVDTCKEKYGVENVSQLESIQKKKEDTFMKNYGVDNIFKDPEAQKMFGEVIEERYGSKRISGWHKLDEAGKLEWLRRLNSSRGKQSKLETRVANILTDLGINWEPRYEIKGKYYDFRIKGLKLLIEVNGDFWHANPKKYKAKDILPFPTRNGVKREVTAESLWKKDEKKLNIARNSGFFCMSLWEGDLKQMGDEELSLTLMNKVVEVMFGSN